MTSPLLNLNTTLGCWINADDGEMVVTLCGEERRGHVTITNTNITNTIIRTGE